MSVRVYIPATLPALAGFVATGVIPSSLERFTAADETEESEYAALMSAADASAELLSGAGRRLVVVAEVADPDGSVPMSVVVAVHADAEDFTDGDDDLGWYAPQEIPALLRG